MKLASVVGFLNETLAVNNFEGDTSLNGLQVEGSGNVTKVTLAVDACDISIRRAVREGSDMLIVHHGLFWAPRQPVTGIMAKRVRILLERGISLYAAHLPLDCHPVIGNNARLANILGARPDGNFGDYHGIAIGLAAVLPRRIKVQSLSSKLGKLLEAPVKSFNFGPPTIERIGIVSGGGASLTQAAAETGCAALLTGETAHSSYHIARESRINLLCAGHYATETHGLKALAGLLGEKLGLDTRFADIPTGL